MLAARGKRRAFLWTRQSRIATPPARDGRVNGPAGAFSQRQSFYGNSPLFHPDDGNERIKHERFRVSDFTEVP
jgi:hypothetical protein